MSGLTIETAGSGEHVLDVLLRDGGELVALISITRTPGSVSVDVVPTMSAPGARVRSLNFERRPGLEGGFARTVTLESDSPGSVFTCVQLEHGRGVA